MDWQQLIDESIDQTAEAPTPAAPVERRLTDGRRALRRRRLGSLAATAAVVAGASVAALAWPASTGGPDTRPLVAGSDTRLVPGDLDVPVGSAGWTLVGFRSDGTLVRGAADVTLTGRYDDVWPSAQAEVSLVEVVQGGERFWVLAEWSPVGSSDPAASGSSGSRSAPADPTRTFEEWVADSVADPESTFRYSGDDDETERPR